MPGERLQVGIVIDDDAQQPAWICRAIAAIRESQQARIAVVARGQRDRKSETLAERTYKAFDWWRFGRRAKALHRQPVAPFLSGIAAIDIRQIGDHDLDVIVTFGPPVDSGRARRGIWRYRHDGLREFAARKATADAVLERSDGSILARTRIGADPISFHRGLDRLYWQSVPLLTRALTSTIPSMTEESGRAEGSRTSALTLLPRAAKNLAAQKIRDRLIREQWFPAFRFRSSAADPNDDLRKFHQILPPRDRLWADPFVIQDGDRAFIFVEEMTFAGRHGVISVIEAQRNGAWSSPRVVLERPWHLSYPAVFRWNGDFFMLPEESASAAVRLYRAVQFPWKWEEHAVLMNGVRAVDTTIFELEGRWWMYLSTESFARAFEDLSIYFADSPLGPWRAHPMNPVMSDTVGGRCAGFPFRRNGLLLRPAQDSSRRYGSAVELREIVKLSATEWEERVAARIAPDWNRHLIGLHTFNVNGDVTVVDLLRRRWGLRPPPRI